MYNKFRNKADELRTDDRGALLVIVALSLTVFLGLVALSFDLGRVTITQSQLQSYADSVALAAAGELDGNADSITRAVSAAALISDTQVFGNANNSLQGSADYTLTFLTSLPTNDLATPTAVTTNSRAAVYVMVDVVDATVNLTFAAAFASLNASSPMNNTVGAVAVAGYTQYACDVTPLMFCLPTAGYRAEDHVGDMIALRQSGNSAGWGPGNFGFLDPSTAAVDNQGPCAGLNGATQDRCLIAAEGATTQCVAVRGVTTDPGQRAGITDSAFNVRFDMFGPGTNGFKSNANYAPAPNVIKGLAASGGNGNGNGGNGGGGACVANNASPSPNTVGLPRDNCFGNGSCGGSGRFGTGNWSTGRVAYVNANYGGTDPHPSAVTRWQYYLAEITTAGGPTSTTTILSGLGANGAIRAETGRPTCSPHQSSDPERRIVIAAGIDCTANPVAGRTTNVPVEEFFRMFMTEPVSNDTSTPARMEIHVEIVGSAGGGGAGTGNVDGIFRDVVQLYR